MSRRSKNNLAAIVLALSLATSTFAADTKDVYGDAHLHQIEKEICSLAEESKKDISYQEHEKILIKVSNDLVGNITALPDLAALAIWANLNVHSNEYVGGFINYNHVIRTARSAAINNIGKSTSPDAEATLWKVVHQITLSGKNAEELEAQMSAITKKDFKFKGRLDIHFEDAAFQKLPMTPEFATFRTALCEELWKHWSTQTTQEKTIMAITTFVIDSDRQITNIKVITTHLGKEKDKARALKFEEAARTALEKCAIKDALPSGIKKIRMQVDFYGS